MNMTQIPGFPKFVSLCCLRLMKKASACCSLPKLKTSFGSISHPRAHEFSTTVPPKLRDHPGCVISEQTLDRMYLPKKKSKTNIVYDSTAMAKGANNNNNNSDVGKNAKNNEITIEKKTKIRNFYAGQSVFITGGTGFVGKILIEKLLRSCPDVTKVYLLIRAKKDKNAEDRLEDLLNNPIFDRLRKESPKFRDKVVTIPGDCSSQGLGLSSADREQLVEKVSIVFHSAATVRFDEKIDIATAINVGSTLDVIDLCKRMRRLRAFIHVSTAFANCTQTKIDESFYPHSTNYKDLNALLSSLNEQEIMKMTPKILDQWPNTYTFTKALAEVVIKENRQQGLAMGIFRPAIVTSTAYEPVPGWIDNFYGPTGVVVASARGLLRTMYCFPTAHANIVPVDFTVNALIASAWDVANQPERNDENILIYNYVSTVEALITWHKFIDMAKIYGTKYPLSEIKWTTSLTLQRYKTMDFVSRIFNHYVPAVFVDLVCTCLGRDTMLMKVYKKIHKFLDIIPFFCTRTWIYKNDNVQNMWNRLDKQDKQDFRFSMKELNWDKYMENYIKGLRIYLLKDDLSTLDASRKKLKRFHMIGTTLKSLFFILLSSLLYGKLSR